MARRLEGAVETYLDGQVRALGGFTRKFVSPGRRGAPDRLVFWPGARCDLVETKSKDGSVKAHQAREHARYADLGFRVEVCHTKEAIDQYIDITRRAYLWTFQTSSRSTK